MSHCVANSRGLTEQCEPASASSERPVKNPDSLIYGIRWPANRLTYGQMQTLRQISKDVRLPITQLLKDAVDVYLHFLQREVQAMMVAEQAGQPKVSESDAAAGEGTVLEPAMPETHDNIPLECLDTNATNAARAVMGL